MFGEKEIASSTENQFELEINPNIIPVEATDFTVVSTDDKGNETSEIFSVEFKHLLLTYDYGTKEYEINNETEP